MTKLRRSLCAAALTLLPAGAAAHLAGCTTTGLVPPRQGLVMRDVTYPVKDIRFPSGLRVLAERDDRLPVVSLVLVVGAGSSSDPPGKEGLAHYIEHLTFRSRPFGKSSFRRLLERAGAGSWNAFTGLDDTVYYEVVPKAALPEALKLEGTRMLAPVATIAKEALDVELGVVGSELQQRNETGFVGEVMGAMQGKLFPPNHPYARPVIGTRQSLAALTPEDVAAFLRDHYQPNNMTLLVIGDVDLDAIGGLIEKALQPQLLAGSAAPHPPTARVPKEAPEPPAPPPSGLTTAEAAVATPELWIGWSLPRAFDAEAYLVEATESAAESALEGASRTDPDIAGVSTRLIEGKDASILMARAVLQQGSHPERSLDHVLNRLVTIWANGGGAQATQLNSIAFARSKRFAVVGLLLDTEDITSRGISRAVSTHFSGDPTIYSRTLANVVKLEESTVTEFARKYVTRDRARAILFRPPTGGGALPPSRSVAAPATDEEDKIPIRVDLDRLRGVAPSPGASAYAHYSLENGVDLVVGRRPGLPLVSIGLALPGGLSEAKDPGAAKAAFLLSFPKETWHGEPSDFGGHWRKQLTDNAITYQIEGSSGNAPIMVAILSERVRSMTVDTGAWSPFQSDYVPYLMAADQKPEALAERAWARVFFGSRPFFRSPTGGEIEATSLSATQRFLDTSHSPYRAKLAIVGDVDPDAMAAVVREQFGGWSGSNDEVSFIEPLVPGSKPAAAPNLVVTKRPDATQAQIHYSCALPLVARSADDVRHDLVASLVESRVNHVLREELGLTYGLSGHAGMFRGGTSFLSIRGAVDRTKLTVSLSAIKKALDTLGAEKISAGDLAWAKLRLAQGQATRFASNDAIVGAVLWAMTAGFAIEDVDRYAAAVDAVTDEALLNDVRRCAAGNPTLSIVGDEQAARAAFKEVWP